METRPLGTTGQESSVLTLGAVALNFVGQEQATELVEDAIEAGVNHVDVAPTYGDAELKLAPALEDHREELFLGCKTQERTYYGAWGELYRSLDRLGVEKIDLYQFHAVTRYDELEAILGEYSPEMAQGDHDPGALQAFVEARAAGLIDHIGLTSHGDPSLIRSAIDRIDELETVMFPYNATLAANEGPEYDYDAVIEKANERDLGVQIIKGFAKGSWPEGMTENEQPYNTWYEPYDTAEEIADAMRFVLSADVTTMPSAGEPELLGPMLEAANEYEPMSGSERTDLLERVRDGDQPVPAP